jgi:small conductance mechanosensitive channel
VGIDPARPARRRDHHVSVGPAGRPFLAAGHQQCRHRLRVQGHPPELPSRYPDPAAPAVPPGRPDRLFKDFEGTVEEIETRTTIIKTYDGRRAYVPNGEIFTNAVIVNTAYGIRRSQCDIGIGYGDDVRRAAGAIIEALRNIEGVRHDPPPEAIAMALADSSVVIRARWWTGARQHEVLRVQHEVIAAMKETMSGAGIDLPFPTSVVLFHDQTEETDGDRTRQREGWPPGRHPPRQKTIADSLTRRPAAEGEHAD